MPSRRIDGDPRLLLGCPLRGAPPAPRIRRVVAPVLYWPLMWLLLALAAALLTSFLPIVNKRLLADTPVSVVAWAVNGLSLPILGLAALALAPVPTVDSVFWLGLGASAVLNMGATLVST